MNSRLGLRAVSTIIVMPVVLAILYFGGYWLLLGLAGFYLLAAHEWSHICHEGGSIPVSWLNFLGGLPILYFGTTGQIDLIVPALAALVGVNLVVPPLIGLSGGTVGMDLFGQVYIALPLFYLELLRGHSFGAAALAMLLVWGSDIGAYLVGSAIGRHKLSPRLSPSKSWEGVAGGVAAGVLVGALLSMPLAARSPAYGATVGLLASILALLGDLGESAVKRWANAKDSGQFMPGHGGLLDRMDSLLLALPALYYLLR